MLMKLYLTKPELAVLPLQNIKDYQGFAIVDCFDNIYKNHKNFLPQLFNNKQVFISSNSFQQNHTILSKLLRKYVSNIIKYDYIAIGGESYLYGITNNCNNIIHYTNSKFIYDDCNCNNKFYKKNIENNLVDYNTSPISDKYNYCLLNLSKLPENLMKKINSNLYIKLVIISCNHDDFWKKIKYLSNYRLIQRKKFICEKIGYFISVNIFIPTFIGLGSNCSTAYQMKKIGIRREAFPFDWTKIKFRNLLNVFRNNFESFDKLEVVKFSENHENSYILKNKYCNFAHEVCNLNKLDDFEKKIQKRVIKLLNKKSIIFVRLELDNILDYRDLEYELDKYFTNYKLVVISKRKPLGNIIHFELPEFIDWKFNNFDWSAIFQDIM